jgi:hypothetical protein
MNAAMTTAQHRNAASDAVSALNWLEAAAHLDAAIAKHPAHQRPRGVGAMDKMDMENMAKRAASYRFTAKAAA